MWQSHFVLPAGGILQQILSEDTTLGGQPACHRKPNSQFDRLPLASQSHIATSCSTVPGEQEERQEHRGKPAARQNNGRELVPILMEHSDREVSKISFAAHTVALRGAAALRCRSTLP